MKRLMFIGPSQCGKTSLTQSLRGEALHYKKTQAIEWSPMAIDTPGEYLENRCLYSALLTSACEADVIALVLNADAQWSPFFSGFYRPDEPPDDWPGHQGRSRRAAAYFAGCGVAYAGWRTADFYYQRAE